MKGKNKIIGIFTAIAIFLCSFNLLYINADAAEGSVIEEAKHIIENYYINSSSNEAMNSDSIEDMVDGLNDPYSSYFTKEEYEEFVNSIDNKFVGIGVQVLEDEEGILISNVIKNTPAEEARLMAGDIIIKANDINLKGLSTEEAVTYIKGEEGTSVFLSIKRGEDYLQVSAQRRKIAMPTVKGTVLKNNIGYIGVYSFGENTPNEFRNALENLEKSSVNAYIVDLRYNTGGYVQSALDIGGHFIGNNPMMIMRDSYGNKATLNGYIHENIIKKPIIFLINEYSASASEILSAAVKDYGKALFIGDTTYGKGVAQNMFSLSDGSMLKLTTFEFLSPKGSTINDVGIKPDFHVDGTYTDPLNLAHLLLSQEGNSGSMLKNKDGYIKVLINDNYYYINLDEARRDENWESYKYLINNIDSKNLFLGQGEEWITSSLGKVEDEINLIFPNSKVMKSLSKNKEDKIFTITFNKAVDINIIDDEDIELINSHTGERAAFHISSANENKVTLNLKEKLDEGRSYYIFIDNEIKSKDNKGLNKETVVKVNVK